VTASLAERRRRDGPAASLWSAWSRFWFTPIPAARLGLLRIWLFGFVFFDVLLRKEVSVAMGDTPRLFWHPVGATWLLDQVGVGPPDGWQIRLVQIVLLLAAAAACIGWRYRLAGPIAAVMYLYWQSLGQSWGEMKHARVSLVLGLLFLATVSAGQRRSVGSLLARVRRARVDVTIEPRPDPDEPSTNGAWAVRAVQVGVAALYFLSGYSKLRAIGVDWVWGDTLRQAIQDKASSGETTALGFWVLDHAWVLILFQAVALLWELCFPLVFWRPLRYPVIIVGLLFNIGLWTTVKIEFFGVLACFAAFFPLEQWEQALRRRWAARRADPPAALHHDPACARCAGDVAAALAGDWAHRLQPVPGGHVGSADLDAAPLSSRLTRAAVDRLPGTPPHTVALATAEVEMATRPRGS
jgi:hypothetical protein